MLRERGQFDRRVALTPAVVRRLIASHHTVWVESGAGDGAMFRDNEYIRAGAQIAYSPAEVIQRVELLAEDRPSDGRGAEPLPSGHGADGVLPHGRGRTARCSTRWRSAASPPSAARSSSRTDGTLPVLSAISEIAGQMTIPIAAHLLRSSSGGRGILLGGTPGVPPARIVIIGAGAVGFAAVRTRRGRGRARHGVRSRPAQAAPRRWSTCAGVETCLADEDAIAEAVAGADIVIGAILVAGTRTPHVVTRAMVERMKPGRGDHRRFDRPGRLRRDQPAHHAGRADVRLPRRDALLRSEFHRGPGPRRRSVAIAQATLPYLLSIARHGVDGRHSKRVPNWRAAFTCCAGRRP